MAYDKEENENDWDYLHRKAPDVFHALHVIEGFQETRKELFDNGTFYWKNDDVVDLTNKIMIGLLQLGIEKLQAQLEDVEEKYRLAKEKEVKWHVFGREKDKVVFENGVGELAKVPLGLLDIIANIKSFDGKILSDGAYVKYVSKGVVICKLPKALVNQLQKKEFSRLGEEGVGD